MRPTKRLAGYSPDATSSGRRALANLALANLCLAARDSGDAAWPGKTYQRFKDATNMTNRMGALSALVSSGHELAGDALARFHSLFQHEELVIDKWFALQAGAPDRGGDVLPRVRQLMKHADFSLRNPNRARSLVSTYCQATPAPSTAPTRRVTCLERARCWSWTASTHKWLPGSPARWTAGPNLPSPTAARRERQSPASRPSRPSATTCVKW